MIKKSLLTSFIIFFAFIFFSTMAFAGGAYLKWDPPANANQVTVDGYKIYYGTTSGDYTEVTNVGNTTRYPVEALNLQPGTTYYLAVSAYNKAGESEKSSEIQYTTLTAPGSPTGVQVIVISNN